MNPEDTLESILSDLRSVEERADRIMTSSSTSTDQSRMDRTKVIRDRIDTIQGDITNNIQRINRDIQRLKSNYSREVNNLNQELNRIENNNGSNTGGLLGGLL